MNCNYTYNTPDGFDHVLDVEYQYHDSFPGTRTQPGETDWCEVIDWICQTHDDCRLNDGNLPDKELERIEEHCLAQFHKGETLPKRKKENA